MGPESDIKTIMGLDLEYHNDQWKGNRVSKKMGEAPVLAHCPARMYLMVRL